MSSLLLLSLAARNLWRNRRRTLIALTAIVIGSLLVVILNGFRHGVIDLMTEGMVKAQVGAFQVHRAGYMDLKDAAPTKLAFADTAELRGRILSAPGVSDLAPRISTRGMATAGARSSLVFLIAGDPASERRVLPVSQRFIAGGKLTDEPDSNKSVLGGQLMENLKLQRGDTFVISATTPEGQSNALDLVVEGWVPAIDPFNAKRLLAFPLNYAQKLLRMEGRVTEYAVQVRDLHRIDEAAAAVRQALGPQYEVHTWLEIMPMYRDLIRRQNFVLSAVSLVLLVIVLTGIVNVMAMSVYERVREIGTEMALGMRRRHILWLFLAEGGLLGLWGGMLGAALGGAVVFFAGWRGVPFKAPGTSGWMPLYPTVPTSFLALVVVASVAGALGAALLAAMRASRLRPADALRAL
jgi:putative ABC transport system permease protein